MTTTQESLYPVLEMKPSEYKIDVECTSCENTDDDLRFTVEATSAVEALYKAARSVIPLLSAPRPANRRQTLSDDFPEAARYLHQYDIEIACDYGSDVIDGMSGEANSPAEALYQGAAYDALAREHRATEW